MNGPHVPFADSSPVPGAAWAQTIKQRLFEQRVVVLSGALDEVIGGQVGAELMTLDAIGDEPVLLQIDSSGGSVDAALAVMDVVELLGIPVHASCIGQVNGPAIGVVAVAHHRAASPHTRFRLCEPNTEYSGHWRELEQWAKSYRDRWEMFCERVADSTGQSAEKVSSDAAAGQFLSAQEAKDYGLLDEISRPDSRIYRLSGAPLGFQGPRS